jgi:hypothetical protein
VNFAYSGIRQSTPPASAASPASATPPAGPALLPPHLRLGSARLRRIACQLELRLLATPSFAAGGRVDMPAAVGRAGQCQREPRRRAAGRQLQLLHPRLPRLPAGARGAHAAAGRGGAWPAVRRRETSSCSRPCGLQPVLCSRAAASSAWLCPRSSLPATTSSPAIKRPLLLARPLPPPPSRRRPAGTTLRRLSGGQTWRWPRWCCRRASY